MPVNEKSYKQLNELCKVYENKIIKEIPKEEIVKEKVDKKEDISTLTDNALKDACGITNPKQATHEEICKIYEAAM